MTNIELFTKRFKELRKSKFKSQRKASEKLGHSQFLICNWETGKTLPSFLTLIELANYFNVSADYLLGLSDKKEREK